MFSLAVSFFKDPFFLSSPCIGIFHYIKKKSDEGKLLVTITSKLLNYYVHSRYLYWHQEQKEDSLYIVIDSISNEVEGNFCPKQKELEGITFYVPADKKVSLRVCGASAWFIANEKGRSGRQSISVSLE